MPTFQNFAPPNDKQIDTVYKLCRKVMEEVVPHFGDDRSRSVFYEVMGKDASPSNQGQKDAEASLQKTLTAMLMRIATVSFTVKFDASLALNTNANMLSFSAKGDIQKNNDLVDDWRSKDPAALGGMPLTVGNTFFTLPFHQLDVQSQVETFLHELSHHAAGTIDDENGGGCYGWAGVQRLKSLGPARAIRNAENVAFYCVRATTVVP